MAPFTKAANKATPARTMTAVSMESILTSPRLPVCSRGARHHSSTGHRVVGCKCGCGKIDDVHREKEPNSLGIGFASARALTREYLPEPVCIVGRLGQQPVAEGGALRLRRGRLGADDPVCPG